MPDPALHEGQLSPSTPYSILNPQGHICRENSLIAVSSPPQPKSQVPSSLPVAQPTGSLIVTFGSISWALVSPGSIAGTRMSNCPFWHQRGLGPFLFIITFTQTAWTSPNWGLHKLQIIGCQRLRGSMSHWRSRLV